MMTPEEKSIIRMRFRVAAFAFLTSGLLMAFVLAWFDKDVTAFGVVMGGLVLPMTGLLVADYATTPK
ncbi:MAG: hypothetical protein RBS36_04200 [Thiomicrospira sp.]|jgi:hypothetical protein|nr:hypothetical protein [Thiomicrospira sp.]